MYSYPTDTLTEDANLTEWLGARPLCAVDTRGETPSAGQYSLYDTINFMNTTTTSSGGSNSNSSDMNIFNMNTITNITTSSNNINSRSSASNIENVNTQMSSYATDAPPWRAPQLKNNFAPRGIHPKVLRERSTEPYLHASSSSNNNNNNNNIEKDYNDNINKNDYDDNNSYDSNYNSSNNSNNNSSSIYSSSTNNNNNRGRVVATLHLSRSIRRDGRVVTRRSVALRPRRGLRVEIPEESGDDYRREVNALRLQKSTASEPADKENNNNHYYYSVSNNNNNNNNSSVSSECVVQTSTTSSSSGTDDIVREEDEKKTDVFRRRKRASVTLLLLPSTTHREGGRSTEHTLPGPSLLMPAAEERKENKIKNGMKIENKIKREREECRNPLLSGDTAKENHDDSCGTIHGATSKKQSEYVVSSSSSEPESKIICKSAEEESGGKEKKGKKGKYAQKNMKKSCCFGFFNKLFCQHGE